MPDHVRAKLYLATGRSVIRADDVNKNPPPLAQLHRCVANLSRALELDTNCGGKTDLEQATRLLKKHAPSLAIAEAPSNAAQDSDGELGTGSAASYAELQIKCPRCGTLNHQAEYIVWGSKGGMPLDRRAPTLPGVIREKVRRDDKLNMTGKPTGLMRQVVRICEAGGRILDPFAGSNTTLVAAQM